MNPRRITDNEKTVIRLVLKLHRGMRFPRCACRSASKAYKLDGSLGVSKEDRIAAQKGDKTKGIHTKPGHVCFECRCSRTAGQGTYGWWYWQSPGGMSSWKAFAPDVMFPSVHEQYGVLGNVGHYGVGPCFQHGQARIQTKAVSPHLKYYTGGRKVGWLEKRIMRDIAALQQFGSAPDADGKYLVHVDEDEELQVQRDATLALDESRDILNRNKADLESANCTLTEKFGKESGPITDKSRIELQLKVTKNLADIDKIAFLTAQDRYIHTSEFRRFLKLHAQMTESFITTPDEFDVWVRRTREIANTMRRGKQ